MHRNGSKSSISQVIAEGKTWAFHGERGLMMDMQESITGNAICLDLPGPDNARRERLRLCFLDATNTSFLESLIAQPWC
ncbi:hypothetical protein CDAR_537031 [Caerostris darwini]|uniref:Uncharacterized protein n=1 Tax=Caerostris darwini TaxID=1538125 RepID=A0AAV4PK41_9ARAC|nr:hypothetical protein CDAR_537031 [Caerostris darwini]